MNVVVTSTVDKFCINTQFSDLNDFVKYILIKVENATKMNSKCSYTYVDELLIVCWTVEELDKLLILMILYYLSMIREIKC